MHARKAKGKEEELLKASTQPKKDPSAPKHKSAATKAAGDFSTPANKAQPKTGGLTYLQISLRKNTITQQQQLKVGAASSAATTKVAPTVPTIVNVKNAPVMSGETPRKSFPHTGAHPTNLKSASSTNVVVPLKPKNGNGATLVKYQPAHPEILVEKSFASVSSVTVNYDGLINSEADFFIDSCVDSFVKPGQKKLAAAISENKNSAPVPVKVEPIKVFINENYYDVLKGLTENEGADENVATGATKTAATTTTKRLPKEMVKSVLSPRTQERKSSTEKNKKLKPAARKSVAMGRQQEPAKEPPMIVKAVLRKEPRVQREAKSKGRNKTIATSRSGKFDRLPKALDKTNNEPTTRKTVIETTVTPTAIAVLQPLQAKKSLSGLHMEEREQKRRSHSMQNRIHKLRDERKLAKNPDVAPLQEKLNFFASVNEIDRTLDNFSSRKIPTITPRPDQTPSVQISLTPMQTFGKINFAGTGRNQGGGAQGLARGSSVEGDWIGKKQGPTMPLLSPKLPY
jgi:hypothetical protein